MRQGETMTTRIASRSCGRLKATADGDPLFNSMRSRSADAEHSD
jgi:hypothetical protein